MVPPATANADRSGDRSGGWSTYAVYETHFDFVWKNLRRLGVRDPQLEDAVQDVFSVVHRRAATFDGSSRIETWLYGILRRVASHYRRREERHNRRLEAVRLEPTVRESAEVRFAQREELRLVESFLRQLDEPKRDVFVLAHLEQMSGREMSDLLGVNANTASARLRAARREFAEFLREHEVSADIASTLAREERGPEPTKRRVLAGLLPILGPASPGTPAMVQGPPLPWLQLSIGGAGLAVIALGIAATVAGSSGRGAGQPIDVGTEPPSAAVVPRPPTPPPTAVPIRDAEEDTQPPVTIADSPATPTAPKRTETPVALPPKRLPVRPAPIAASDLAEQTRLAKRVSAGGSPRAVLQRIEDYERKFPAGFFSERLGVKALSALCELDQLNKAKLRATALRSQYPRSSLLPRDPNVPCADRSRSDVTKVAAGGDTPD